MWKLIVSRLEEKICETDVLAAWRRGRDDCCCPFPGCCTQWPSPSSQHQTQPCRWCSWLTQSSKCWHGGEPQTCRLAHTVSGSTLCSHNSTPPSIVTTTATQVTNHWYDKNTHLMDTFQGLCGSGISRTICRQCWRKITTLNFYGPNALQMSNQQ